MFLFDEDAFVDSLIDRSFNLSYLPPFHSMTLNKLRPFGCGIRVPTREAVCFSLLEDKLAGLAGDMNTIPFDWFKNGEKVVGKKMEDSPLEPVKSIATTLDTTVCAIYAKWCYKVLGAMVVTFGGEIYAPTAIAYKLVLVWS